MYQNPKVKKFLLSVLLIPFCFSFLSGCAGAPIQTSDTYFQELYKRIPYETQGGYRIVNVYYATTREIKGRPNSPESFRPALAQEISYGDVNVKIDPRLTIGQMLPDWYKKKGIIGLQRINVMEKDIFFEKLAEAVEDSPHNSLLVVVFGYKDNFEHTAIKASYFSYLLDINTPILFFDWPGDQAVTPWGYFEAQRLAKASGLYLGNLMAEIKRKIHPKKLWLTASSLGAQVVSDAFEEMCKCKDLSDEDREIDHIILSAPDVGEDEFDSVFGKEVKMICKKLTTYVASNDEALLLSGIIGGKERLGRKKIRLTEQSQLREAKNILYLKSLEPNNVALVDVTPINRASYKHGYYLEAPEYFDDLYFRLLGIPPYLNRRLYLLKYKDNVDYWVLLGSD